MAKFFTLIVLLSFIFIQEAKCQLFGWNYYTPVTIVETSGSPQFNVEVAVTLNTATYVSAQQMSSTGSDIRFGNNQYGDKLYPYWIQSGMNSSNTTFYIKLDTLLGYQCKTVYMFYGNSGAVAVSSPDSVFAGPYSATNYSQGNGRTTTGAPPSNLGMEFSTNTGIVITRLGLSLSATTGYYCTLFNYNTHAVIAQQQITSAGNNQYVTLPSPVYLSPGTYMLAFFSPYGTYNYGNTTTLNTGLTYLGTWEDDNSQPSNFPYTRKSNQLYGIPDMIYYLPQSPTSAVTSFIGTNGLTLTPATPVNDCQGHTITIGDTARGAGGSVAYIWTPTTGLSNAHVAQPQITPATNQTYTVTARDGSNGCTASAVIVVNVVNPTSATITDSVCYGQAYYVGQHVHAVAGTYTDTIVSSGGCDSIVTLHLAIHHPVQPAITQNGDALTTGNYTVYQWLLNGAQINGATGVSLRANASGNYQVIGTDATGCADTSVVYAFSTLGLSNATGNAEINLYPNPGNGNFYMSTPASFLGAAYTVIDNLGRKIATGNFSAGKTELNLTTVPAGVYTITYTGGSKRLVVTK